MVDRNGDKRTQKKEQKAKM